MKKLALTFILLANLLGLRSEAAIEYQPGWKGQFPDGGIKVFLDESKTLSLDEVIEKNQFQAINFDKQSFGWIQARGWAKIEIFNPLPNPVSVIIEHESIEIVKFYQLKSDGQLLAIDDLRNNSFFTDLHASRYHAILVSLEPGLNQIFESVDGTAIRFPLKLWQSDFFVLHNRKEILTYSLIFGAFAVLFIYNLIVMISTKSLAYIYNVVYLLAITLLNATLSGYFYFFSTDFGQLMGPYWIQGLGLACVAYIMYSKYIMNEFLSHFQLHYLRFFAVYYGLFFLWILIDRSFAMKYLFLGLFCFWPMMFCLGIKHSLQGYKPALFYTAGWVSIAAGGTVTAAVYGGLLQSTPLIQNASVFGMILDLVFRTLAYAEKAKYNELQALSVALEKETKNKHLLSQLQNLVYPHQVQIIKNNRTINETMPLSSAKACVIAFDIQNSSLIGHSQHAEFFANVIKACYSYMNLNYDEHKLSANAYMIKEMGDGFICSIGFPFRCEGSVFAKAIELTEKFVSIINQESKSYFPDRQVYCGMGVAYSDVTGFFPKAGLQYYDLYGDAIVKAKRYEEFRKVLQKHLSLPESNITIIHQDVYMQLNELQQAEFTSVELTDKRSIRDDPTAHVAYVKCIDSDGKAIALSMKRGKEQAV
ncbi:MAG: 7TM diverse intracellular signaling domain-containing protein [Oligoflexus sp.]